MIGEVITLLGALLVLLAAIGVMRFDDPLARMHALAKGSTLGVVLLLLGAAVSLQNTNDVTSLLLAALLQVLASPPASNLLSRATYLGSVRQRDDVVDERARDHDEPTDER